MGNDSSKKDESKKDKSDKKPQAMKDQICLAVLHDRSQPPNMKNFRQALNRVPKPGSLKLAEKKDCNVSSRQDIDDAVSWMSQRLTQGYILLVALLTNYNFQALKEGIDRKERIIEFCFKDPKVDGVIQIDVDIDTATPESIKEKMDELVAEIRGKLSSA